VATAAGRRREGFCKSLKSIVSINSHPVIQQQFPKAILLRPTGDASIRPGNRGPSKKEGWHGYRIRGVCRGHRHVSAHQIQVSGIVGELGEIKSRLDRLLDRKQG
jgi:hypothetical protein